MNYPSPANSTQVWFRDSFAAAVAAAGEEWMVLCGVDDIITVYYPFLLF